MLGVRCGVVLGLAVVAGCDLPFLDRAETEAVLQETMIDAEGIALTASSIELGSIFAMNQTEEQSAEQLREVMDTELGCQGLSLDDTTVSIEYGTCHFEPNPFGGTHSITIEQQDAKSVRVGHRWDQMSNGHIAVDGTAEVTWDADTAVRHVVDSFSWTRLKDGRTGSGGGERDQGPLPDRDVFDGLKADGSRTWQGRKGHYGLSMQGIQVLWNERVPYTGVWTVQTPNDRVVSFAFSRIDDQNIGVHVDSGNLEFELNVDHMGFASPRGRAKHK